MSRSRRMLPIALACLVAACAGGQPPASPPPAGDDMDPAPIQLRDARTGFALRVPKGWALAPPAVYAVVAAEKAQPPRRLLFVLAHEESALRGEIVLLAATSEPLDLLPETARGSCSELSRQLGFEALGAQQREPLRVDDHELCALRLANAQGRPLYFWSGEAGRERLNFFVSTRDELAPEVEAIVSSAHFEPPDPEADVSSRRGHAERSLHDDATGASLEIPEGWTPVPGVQVRKLMEGAAALKGPESGERFVFLVVRDDTLDKPEVVGLVTEKQPPGSLQPRALDELCQSLLPLLQTKDAEATREADRSIGGRAFCSFRFSSAGRTNLVFANLADDGGSLHRIQVALASEDRARVDALLDAIRFE